MNEFDLIEKIFRTKPSPKTLIGVGDDGSVVGVKPSQKLVQSTDLLVESVHFRRDWISLEDLGRKALAVNLSDILAMGAEPHWAHLTLAIPESVSEKDLKLFAKGFLKTCAENSIDLIGGDLSFTPGPWVIGVHLSGLAKEKHLQRRQDFSEADLLCVTGPLGDSSLGLWCLQKGLTTELAKTLIGRHHRPPIQTDVAFFLRAHKAVRGMMDISDGLVSDLQHLPGAWQLDCDQVPLSEELKQLCQRQVLRPMSFALAGGEDYQLLFGVRKKHLKKFSKDFAQHFAKGPWIIGKRDHKKTSGVSYSQEGVNIEPPKLRFQHFSRS